MTIGILTALPVEGAAMASLLDGQRRFSAPGDPNNYRLGELPSNDPQLPHRVALVVLPRDGTRQAAAVCNDLIRTFPRVRCVMMVGVAGGIPRPLEPPRHVRLGDVVVATDGIVDYGHVRRILGGQRLRRLSEGLVSGWLLRRPPQRVAQPVADLRMHDQRTYLVRGRAVRALKGSPRLIDWRQGLEQCRVVGRLVVERAQQHQPPAPLSVAELSYDLR